MRRHSIAIAVAIPLFLSILSGISHAYWVWTPQTKKFINPKYAVKDTPKEQYDWAMGFYNGKDYQRAATEFEKLVKSYEYSEYASDAQYRVGLCYDNQGKYYIAFQNYQKAVDNFPHVTNIDEIIAREYNIANIYSSKANPKVLGTEIMTSFDRAIEIYKKVVDNAPFGKLADEAQFKMALAMKDAGRFDEATIAFQKILDDYPTSKLYEQARYEMANSAYRASLQPAYDAAPTDKALKAFEELSASNTDEKLNKEAQVTIKRLRNKAAEKSYMTAQFYEQQKHYVSAIIYYQDVVDRYPDTPLGESSKTRIEDLKIGNYSHRSAAEFAAQKKSWIPTWPGKEKKAENRIYVKGATPAPAEAPAAAAVGKEAQGKAAEGAVAKEEPKTKAKDSWWSFGLSKEKKPHAAARKKPKKAWSPFGPGSQKAQIKDEAVPAAAAAEEPKTKAKDSWWSFGLSKEKKPGAAARKKPKKVWAPLKFDDKNTQGKSADAQTARPAEEPKAKTKQSWWSLGSGEKGEVKPMAEKKPAKPWAPLSFDNKKAQAKEEAVEAKPARPAEEPKAKTKKSWWSFGLGENKPKADDKPKKPWTPLNFDKSTEGASKDE